MAEHLTSLWYGGPGELENGLLHVSCSGYLQHDQSMVESGLTEDVKNTASFHFRGWTQQESTNMKTKLVSS